MRVELDKMHIDHLTDLLEDLRAEKGSLEYDLSFVDDDIQDVEAEIERRRTLDD